MDGFYPAEPLFTSLRNVGGSGPVGERFDDSWVVDRERTRQPAEYRRLSRRRHGNHGYFGSIFDGRQWGADALSVERFLPYTKYATLSGERYSLQSILCDERLFTDADLDHDRAECGSTSRYQLDQSR